MASLLEWTNHIRTLLDLPALTAIEVKRTEPDDENRCLVATAIGRPVGASDRPDTYQWVIRCRDRLVARRVGMIMGLEWAPEVAEVDLPRQVIDLAIAQSSGRVEADAAGVLRGWWIPSDRWRRRWQYVSPLDPDFIDGEPWQYPQTEQAAARRR